MNINELEDEELISFIKNHISTNALKKFEMEESKAYYEYEHAIKKKQRLGIGKNGKAIPILNLPNSRIIDNQFAKVVDQKVNYLFSKKPIIECKEHEKYQVELQKLYNMKFLRTLNKIALESYLCGIAWLYVYVKDNELKYKKMDSTEITPIWADKDHESLLGLIRVYVANFIENGKIKNKQMIEFYTDEKIKVFEVGEGGEYILNDSMNYMVDKDKQIGYSFEKIPFIYFKSNSKEIPLLNKCKSLQDGINTIISNFQDNMLEDKRNTILTIKNYDGQDLSEFRQNLAQYGAVKIRDDGGVEALEIKVDSENYKIILELLKEKLIENTRGIDVKNNRSTNAPNELNIKSMYADIELDANAIELEFQASLSHLEWFYRTTKRMAGSLDIDDYETNITFKRNIMINDAELVDNLMKSTPLLSRKTLIAKHPYINNLEDEIKQIKDEVREEAENTFGYIDFENSKVKEDDENKKQ